MIDQLGIDLPVIAQPNASYPSCNVAMYLQARGLGQPGNGRSIYLYAHARDGMFGPLYERAILGKSGGAKSLQVDARPRLHERRPAVRVRDHAGPARA